MIDVSICMITYNKRPFLEKSLHAIVGSVSRDKRVELIVLDNGSNDGTKKVLADFGVHVPHNVRYIVVHSNKNVGLNGYGMIVPRAAGKIIVTADDDIFKIEPMGWEERFRIALTSTFGGKRFGYVSTDTINEDGGRMKEHALGYASNEHVDIEIGPAGGWFAATTKEVIDKVGGFHTGMPEMYLEDADFQNRVVGKGYLVGTLLSTRVLHARGPSYYTALNCESTYKEKKSLAAEAGIILEPLT